MNVLLLAAGRGIRLGPVTEKVPKCLVPVAGRPLLEYWLEQLDCCDLIESIFVNTFYRASQVDSFLATSIFARKVQIIREDKLWGTGGTLARLIDSQGIFEEGLLVAHADNLSLFKLDDFLESHNSRPKACLATVMTFNTDTPSSCGIFRLNKQKVVIEVFEKVSNSPGRLANGAVFVLSPEALSLIKNQFQCLRKTRLTKREVFDLSRDFLPRLLGKLWTYHNDVYHRDIGTPISLHTANSDFLNAKTRFLMEGAKS